MQRGGPQSPDLSAAASSRGMCGAPRERTRILGCKPPGAGVSEAQRPGRVREESGSQHLSDKHRPSLRSPPHTRESQCSGPSVQAPACGGETGLWPRGSAGTGPPSPELGSELRKPGSRSCSRPGSRRPRSRDAGCRPRSLRPQFSQSVCKATAA